jgi:hypothetical protein
VTIEDWPFNLWFHLESADLSLYAEVSSTKSTAPAYEIIKRISKRSTASLPRADTSRTSSATIARSEMRDDLKSRSSWLNS